MIFHVATGAVVGGDATWSLMSRHRSYKGGEIGVATSFLVSLQRGAEVVS